MARVLVVDDERSAAALLEQYLALQGFEVRSAATLAAAQAIAREFPPDVLLADWLLNEATGLEVAQRIQADGGRPLIIFITGLPPEQVRAAASRIPHSQVLEKPISLEVLLQVMRAGLAARQERRNDVYARA